MNAELGLFFLILALLCSLMQAAFLYPHPQLRELLKPCLPHAAWLQAFCIALAFVTLVVLRIDSDFSVATVAAHSNHSLPLLYKIAGTWGNHEGSMVLWALVLSVFGLALSLQCHSEPKAKNPDKEKILHFVQDDIITLALAVQSALTAGTLLFIIFTSNPFARLFPPPEDGAALNPVLQDVALAMHPPLLYVGYVGFSLVFSLAVAALLTGQPARRFAEMARPWIFVAWSALTLGIGLGSWWAYRELGWGGFWFWDAVENASLLPWLAGTALLHSNIILQKRGALAQWTILLAIITFGLSLLGTFLVRSGALTSVHSFASDPARGLFILAYIAVVIGGALHLFATRASSLESAEKILPLSREGMIVINNLFLLSACATVLLGTLYPLFAEWLSGDKVTVGAPYFTLTFVPLMILPVFFAGLALFMPWGNSTLTQVFNAARYPLLAAITAALITAATVHTQLVMSMVGLGLGVWLFGCSVAWLKPSQKSAHRFAVFLAHGGAAVLVIGITGAGLWQQERSFTAAQGDAIDIGGYRVTYQGEKNVRGENYDARRGEFSVERHGKPVTSLLPEYRVHDINRTPTSEAAIYSTWGADLYAVIGEANDKKTSARLYYVPMIQYVWLGCLMMAIGGVIGWRRGVKS